MASDGRQGHLSFFPEDSLALRSPSDGPRSLSWLSHLYPHSQHQAQSLGRHSDAVLEPASGYTLRTKQCAQPLLWHGQQSLSPLTGPDSAPEHQQVLHPHSGEEPTPRPGLQGECPVSDLSFLSRCGLGRPLRDNNTVGNGTEQEPALLPWGEPRCPPHCLSYLALPSSEQGPAESECVCRERSPVCVYIKTRAANVTALPFAAWSMSDAKLTALFHSLLTVTLWRKEGLPPPYRWGDRGLERLGR